MLQVGDVGDHSKTVVLLAEVDSFFLRLTGHVLVTVQHHLCAKGRVSAHFDRQVPPVRVQDMKRIMIDVGPWLFGYKRSEFAGTGPWCIPNQCWSLRHQNQEEAGFYLMGREMFGCDGMLTLPGRTVHHGNRILFGPSSQTATEAPRHAHQMMVVQVVVGALQRTPPRAQASSAMPHREVRVSDHTIDAIVTALDQIAVESAQLVRHAFGA